MNQTIINSLRHGFESVCGTWVLVLQMRPYYYKSRSRVVAAMAIKRAMSAKHRSKFAALSPVTVTTVR
jgi:hypothetical protein